MLMINYLSLIRVLTLLAFVFAFAGFLFFLHFTINIFSEKNNTNPIEIKVASIINTSNISYVEACHGGACIYFLGGSSKFDDRAYYKVRNSLDGLLDIANSRAVNLTESCYYIERRGTNYPITVQVGGTIELSGSYSHKALIVNNLEECD